MSCGRAHKTAELLGEQATQVIGDVHDRPTEVPNLIAQQWHPPTVEDPTWPVAAIRPPHRRARHWWLFPLLPATAACAMYAVFGHDRRVVLLVQQALGELGADFKAPPNTHRAPTTALGMTSPVVVSDPEWLEARRQEVGDSLTGGWSESVVWIKLVVLLSRSLVGIAALGVLTSTVSHTARTWHTPAGWHWNDVVATIDDPVHAYLTAHSAGLPLPVTSLHLLWVASGAALLLMSFLFGGFGARTTWVVWGAITVIMVWSGTPGPARQVAAGLATVAWGLASILAMRGLNLRSITSHSVVVSKDS